MICIKSLSSEPAFNLATEEYLLRQTDYDACVLYINSPSIIVGKHQNAIAEVNLNFANEHNIPVFRRISGGGTVYHDTGNLNFCFILNGKAGELVDFKKYTSPIVNYLKTVGITAGYEGSNNLTINGLKISGNAEHVYKNRVLHHGTLLFNSNLETLQTSLRPKAINYTDKTIKSKPWPVTNILDHLNSKMSINQFRDQLFDYLISQLKYTAYNLSNIEIEAIKNISKQRYSTWEWNYGYTPHYEFTKEIILNNSVLNIQITVKKGIITHVNADGSD
ncbi:MAG: biotin/lipoate A/B protein ligase family protein, partial [Salinivirgaceae bacterium]|nr:biotin/lipoate A/B protein ligase family protein [Salinivirgaceae bacterium]